MSREQILETIQKNRPEFTELPDILSPKDDGQLLAQFQEAVQSAGGTSQIVEQKDSVADFISNNYPDAMKLFADKDEYGIISSPQEKILNPRDYQDIDVAIISGELAVAENGAIWVTDQFIKYRSVWFLAQHLVIVIKPQMLVPDMLAAYQQLKTPNSEFGCFVSGPSKTADIEQSLVIGAHGPKSLSVLICN